MTVGLSMVAAILITIGLVDVLYIVYTSLKNLYKRYKEL